MKFIAAYFSRLLFVLFVLLALVPAEGSLRKSKKKGTKNKGAETRSLRACRWKKNKLLVTQASEIEWEVGDGQKVAKNDHLITIKWLERWQDENTAEPNMEKVYSPLAGSVKIHHINTASNPSKGRAILKIEQ